MCLCISVFVSFCRCCLSHLHFKFSQTQREKKKPVLFRHVIIPQFLSPHPKHAVKPLTFIIRMTCFSRLRQAVLAINSEGRSLPRHVDRLTGTRTHKCFCCVTNRTICLRRRVSRLKCSNSSS